MTSKAELDRVERQLAAALERARTVFARPEPVHMEPADLWLPPADRRLLKRSA